MEVFLHLRFLKLICRMFRTKLNSDFEIKRKTLGIEFPCEESCEDYYMQFLNLLYQMFQMKQVSGSEMEDEGFGILFGGRLLAIIDFSWANLPSWMILTFSFPSPTIPTIDTSDVSNVTSNDFVLE
ncbi:Uncharacterized protein Fot_37742 [Forsythia ovata]|uniref:Uncharacterized protein n=1 Tax=Forsythia ovata TaxID=205694 RepID=A0ABD1RZU7_9LAMI